MLVHGLTFSTLANNRLILLATTTSFYQEGKKKNARIISTKSLPKLLCHPLSLKNLFFIYSSILSININIGRT